MKKNYIIIVIIILVVLLLALWAYSNSKTKRQNSLDTNNNSIANTRTDTDTITKTFDVEASNFVFSLKEIKVKEGEKVVINFVNKEGFHDFVLDEFNAKTSQLKAGGIEKLEFIANKKGTFEYYCSVGQHRQMGMKGNFVVE